MDRIRGSLGIAEAYMGKPELIALGRGQGSALLEGKGLGPGEALPQGGKVEAVPVQLSGRGQNPRNPGGETAHGGKVKQELGGTEALAQGKGDEIGIGHAVVQQGQQDIDDVGPKVDTLGAVDKVVISPQRSIPQIVQPGLHAKDADILCGVNILGQTG